MAVFDALLLVPVDYFPRNVKVELIRRALCLDTALWSQNGSAELTTYQWLHNLRMLVNRLLPEVGPSEQPVCGVHPHIVSISLNPYYLGSATGGTTIAGNSNRIINS